MMKKILLEIKHSINKRIGNAIESISCRLYYHSKKNSKHPIKYPFSLLYFHCTFAFAILHELLTYFHYDTRTI